jgi:hypothetical protein
LSSVSKLDLSGCKSLTDISPLQNAKYLDLTGCCGVTDVSMLGNVPTLILRACRDISDLSGLTNVRNLSIDRIGDPFSKLESPLRAGLPENNHIDNLWISPALMLELKKVKASAIINVDVGCLAQNDILQKLSKFKKVNLCGSSSARLVAEIQSIKELSLTDFVQLREIRNLFALTHLTVEGSYDRPAICPELKQLPMLKVLKLSNVFRKDAPFVLLANIKDVVLKHCQLHSVEIKASLKSLVIKSCIGFDDEKSPKIKNDKNFAINHIRISHGNVILVEKWK